MTPSPAREARIRMVSEGVVASYIRELSSRGSDSRGPQRRRRELPHARLEILARTEAEPLGGREDVADVARAPLARDHGVAVAA